MIHIVAAISLTSAWHVYELIGAATMVLLPIIAGIGLRIYGEASVEWIGATRIISVWITVLVLIGVVLVICSLAAN